MKIMIINVFRDSGSTGKIISALGSYLEKRGNVVSYVYRDGPDSDHGVNYHVGRRLETALTYRINYLLGTPYGGASLSTARIKRIIKAEKPDVISMHSINGSYVNIPSLIRWIGRVGIPLIITHHSEYLYTGNCVYSYECKEWIRGCRRCNHLREYHLSFLFQRTYQNFNKMRDAFLCVRKGASVSVSPWVNKKAKISLIERNLPQYVIANGIDDKVFYRRTESKLRKKWLTQWRGVVLHVTSSFSCEYDRKGGGFVIDLAKSFIDKRILFVVVALQSDVIDDLPENVVFLGAAKNQNELADYYSAADALLLTSRRETFSMPTAESLMCGTPVVGFKAGGPESIAIPHFCEFVDYGRVDLLALAMEKTLNAGFDSDEIAKKAKNEYSIDIMCHKYEKLIRSLT